MSYFSFKRIQITTLLLLLIAGISFARPAGAFGPRDVLYEIVSNCMDTTVWDYCRVCRWPRTDQACPQNPDCKNTTELWAESDNYVVIRDSKMCGCPEGFVHGLALPRTHITGIEDKVLPDGIWKFAWESASKRIEDQSAIALVVNPREERNQDQLHVHLLRLKAGARKLFAGRPEQIIHVGSLDKIWGPVKERAAALRLYDYGVLVASDLHGGFMVVVQRDSPEKMYTMWRCSETRR